jgi:hypothetical protein
MARNIRSIEMKSQEPYMRLSGEAVHPEGLEVEGGDHFQRNHVEVESWRRGWW